MSSRSVASAAIGITVVPCAASSVITPSRRSPGLRDTATTVPAPIDANCRIRCGPILPVAPTTR
ncbi:Uncharacterised protein [Mycobacteroides abscessus subsp. abscessus]|nr:Uncharacterised protein [Mycobacteroides abscessus subsp. abscessus]